MWHRVGLAVFLMIAPIVAVAQVNTWWALNQGENMESGKLQEIKEKRRVFVTVIYRSTDPDQVSAQHERDLIGRTVMQAVTAYKGLEVVSAPERAEMAITVTATDNAATGAGGNFSAGLDPGIQTPLEVLVLVRGAMQRDGGYRPRVVWEISTQNVRGDPAPAAGFFIDGFIGQLKKLRGEDKK